MYVQRQLIKMTYEASYGPRHITPHHTNLCSFYPLALQLHIECVEFLVSRTLIYQIAKRYNDCKRRCDVIDRVLCYLNELVLFVRCILFTTFVLHKLPFHTVTAAAVVYVAIIVIRIEDTYLRIAEERTEGCFNSCCCLFTLIVLPCLRLAIVLRGLNKIIVNAQLILCSCIQINSALSRYTTASVGLLLYSYSSSVLGLNALQRKTNQPWFFVVMARHLWSY